MKKLLTLMSLLIVAVCTWAQTFTIGDLTYSVLSTTDKTVSVSNGANATGDVVVPQIVNYNDVEYSVTAIGGAAFASNKNITSVVIPSATSIGGSAFQACSSLLSVNLPSATTIGDYAFSYCSSLSSVSLPSATTIGAYAFRECSSLTSVSLPSATSIYGVAFTKCSSLSSVSLPSATSIGREAFNACYSLSSVSLPSATTIGSSAFSSCSKISSLRIGSAEQWCKVTFGDSGSNPLQNASQQVDLYIGDSETPATSVELPSTVTEIPNSAFERTTITSFSAPCATSIGSSAFYYCSLLNSVNLPCATSIGSYAFYYCSSLSSVNLPSATTIGSSAFTSCSKISSLRIGSAEQWCKVTFGNSGSNPLQNTSQQVDLYIGNSETPATSVELPSTVTEIPNCAFRRTTISSFSAPCATSISDRAFYSCSSLSSVSLPCATSIGSYAFAGCESLEEVIMPKVETLSDNAFYYSEEYEGNNRIYHYCKSLKTIDLSSAVSIGSYAFSSCSNISSLRIGSAEQWCKVTFGNSGSNPLQNTSQQVDLYIGNSETPATSVELPSTVTEIPNYAFRRTTISSFSAPCATSIGSYAFSSCSSLSSVSLPCAAYIGSSAFSSCSSLSSVSLPCATSIESSAFSSCSYLSSVSLPCTTYIGSSAFSSCSSLSSVNLPCATSIGSYTFSSCSSLSSVSLPSATSIGSSAFSSCSKISSLRIGSAEQWCKVNFGNSGSNPLVETSQHVDLYIGDSETPATSVELSNTVIEIPTYAFRVTTITSFSAPSATSIGSYAFIGCSSLSSVSLPSATSIGNYAFQSCSSLSSVSLPSATSIGNYAFYYCSSLSSVSLPCATTIGAYAFRECSSLTSVSLPCATSIGSSAFYSCSKINSLRIGSVEQYCNIEYANKDVNAWDYAYQFPLRGDKNMNIYIGNSETPATEITIPASVKQVPDYAFIGTSIHTIHFEGTNPPALVNTRSFPTWTMLAAPEEAYETYLAADGYKNIPLQITIDGHLTKVVDMEADATTSKLLMKIGEDEIGKIVNLTIKGTINSYDMMIIRNQMTSLRNLDLSDARIVDCDYVYSNANGVNYHSQADVITADWLNNVLNIKLPSTTKAIGNRAFYNCTRLVSVDIPDGVTSVGDYSFYGCNRIKELSLPQSVTSYGQHAFQSCTGLREVVISDGVTSIDNYAFYDCVDLKKVTIPASVKRIGYEAFVNSNPLELHIASLVDWLSIEFHHDGYLIIGTSNGFISYSGSFNNVTKLYIGNSLESIENVTIPEGTTEIRNYAFCGFKCLENVIFPETLKTIGESAFYGCSGITNIYFSNNVIKIGRFAFKECSGLRNIKLPEKLTAIDEGAFYRCSSLESISFSDNVTALDKYAFAGCSKLTKLELPAYLQTINSYAFQGCSKLSEILIPASIKEIKDNAFQGCSSLNRVIGTTVEPIVINQNTFSTYKTASLFTPKTSYYKYYWNTQWNQFLARKEYDKEFAKSFGYKYFYLNGQNGDQKEDFEVSDETGPIHGIDDKNPDADFNEGAGVIVGGEQVQELGDIHIHHNGNNGASVITKENGKVHIDNLYVDIKVQRNRWYFFCFPFDIAPGEATFDGSHVWYLYDGETRALNGNGGWKKVAADGVMKSGNGYIFQGAVNGTLTIHVADITIDGSDSKTNMITYQSDNKNDASWNLIGNPNIAYYDMDNLDYEAPITVYNNETGNYEAVRPGDDNYEFYPFQAFFVQKPEGMDEMNFEGSNKETKNMADQNANAKLRAKVAKKVDDVRKVINLEVVSGISTDSISAPVDRTRIVINPKKSLAYETECDAAKFVADNMPQIYSLDDEGGMYAINERPKDNGVVSLAVKAAKKGFLTISASRLDCGAKLRDLVMGEEVDLAEGCYTFAAEATTYTDRFLLILGGEATSITAPEVAMDAIAVEAGTISVKDANADVKVYSAGGALVASQKGNGSIKVPAGVYVVNVNGKSAKVTVNE